MPVLDTESAIVPRIRSPILSLSIKAASAILTGLDLTAVRYNPVPPSVVLVDMPTVFASTTGPKRVLADATMDGSVLPVWMIFAADATITETAKLTQVELVIATATTLIAVWTAVSLMPSFSVRTTAPVMESVILPLDLIKGVLATTDTPVNIANMVRVSSTVMVMVTVPFPSPKST